MLGELLLVEDHPLVARALLRQLRASFEVEWAIDFGHAARRVAAADGVAGLGGLGGLDVVICDADLGLDRTLTFLCACVAHQPAARRIVFGVDLYGADAHPLRLFAHAILHKPFGSAAMAHALGDELQRRQPANPE